MKVRKFFSFYFHEMFSPIIAYDAERNSKTFEEVCAKIRLAKKFIEFYNSSVQNVCKNLRIKFIYLNGFFFLIESVNKYRMNKRQYGNKFKTSVDLFKCR